MPSRFDFRCPNIESGEALARFDIGASNIESIWCNNDAYIIGFRWKCHHLDPIIYGIYRTSRGLSTSGV